MATVERSFPAPASAVVVGAGMVGLATAVFLRRAGLRVSVVEADQVAAGSSWGNAGWLTPPLATPLPEPAILAYGARAVTDPASPVSVALRPDPQLLRFGVGFARHSTERAWRRAMGAYVPVNRRALAAFDDLAAAGVREPTVPAQDFVVAFTDAAGQRTMRAELELIAGAGQPVEFEELSVARARELAPALSDGVVGAMRLGGNRYIHPPRFLDDLARTAREIGVEIHERTTVVAVDGGGPRRTAAVELRPTLPRRDEEHTDYGDDRVSPGGPVPSPRRWRRRDARAGAAAPATERLEADVVVLATGTWLGDLARPFGVRMPVQAGRGYSFTVPAEPAPSVPMYFPAQRLACTPLDGRLRVAGMMEFRRPTDPLDPRRIAAMVEAARPLLRGVDLEQRRDEWVGSRPVTPDGLPLIGPTRSPRVVAAGGHGMWGITLGPLTGRLVTELITTGRTPADLWPFDPLR